MNASVQTPNKLLRMVAEEICGQSARKPHAERDFKVRMMVEIGNTWMLTERTKKANGKREDSSFFLQEYAEKLRAEFEQEKKRAVNVATRLKLCYRKFGIVC